MANVVVLGRRTFTITPSIVDIEGMSNANPCVVTWTGHGLSTGDYVSFKGIAQSNWTALNDNSYPVTVLSNNTFSIPVDSSGWGAYQPITDPGKVGHDFVVTRYGFPWGIRFSGLDWHPSLANDRVVVRERSGNGPVIYDRTDTAGGGVNWSVGGRVLRRLVYIKAADLSLNDPGGVRIIVEFD